MNHETTDKTPSEHWLWRLLKQLLSGLFQWQHNQQAAQLAASGVRDTNACAAFLVRPPENSPQALAAWQALDGAAHDRCAQDQMARIEATALTEACLHPEDLSRPVLRSTTPTLFLRANKSKGSRADRPIFQGRVAADGRVRWSLQRVDFVLFCSEHMVIWSAHHDFVRDRSVHVQTVSVSYADLVGIRLQEERLIREIQLDTGEAEPTRLATEVVKQPDSEVFSRVYIVGGPADRDASAPWTFHLQTDQQQVLQELRTAVRGLRQATD